MNASRKKKQNIITWNDILWARFLIEVVDDERCPLIEG